MRPVLLLIAGMAFTLTTPLASSRAVEWLASADSTQVAAWAAIVQAIAATLALLATAILAMLTRSIADETRKMATATSEMVGEAERQRLDAARPVIAFELVPWRGTGDTEPMSHGLHVRLINIGLGPALDVTLRLEETPVEFVVRGGGHAHDPARAVPLPVGKDLLVQYFRSDADLRAGLEGVPSAGVLGATYRDIFGRGLASEADVETAGVERDDVVLRLGPLRLLTLDSPRLERTE